MAYFDTETRKKFPNFADRKVWSNLCQRCFSPTKSFFCIYEIRRAFEKKKSERHAPQALFGDGSHRDNFGESLETLSAVESQSWVSF